MTLTRLPPGWWPVEEGTLTLTVAGEQYQVTAGESARFPGASRTRTGTTGPGRCR